jgi:two-component system chemotaxis response regulator CheB
MSAGRHSNGRTSPAAPASADSEEPALALVVVGLSAGGTVPLRTLLTALPRDFPGALVVARHTGVSKVLPELMRYWAPHPVFEANSGMRLEEGGVYVCPGGHHLIVTPEGTLKLAIKERIAFVRPSIDWLFESAAGAYGARATGVLLSGANGDGARGARALKRAGGVVLVQAPKLCEYPEMPLAALQAGAVSAELAPEDMAPFLIGRMHRVKHQYPQGWADPFASHSAVG